MSVCVCVQSPVCVYFGVKAKVTWKRDRYILTRDCVNLLVRPYLPSGIYTVSLYQKIIHSPIFDYVQILQL